MVTTRKKIPEPVWKRLYALSGNQCAFPGCSAPLTEQIADGVKPSTISDRAHIEGVGRQGPRARSAERVDDDVDVVENLVLFCKAHHKRVDDHPRIYSVEVLAKYKADHEAAMAPKDTAEFSPQVSNEQVDLSVLTVSALPTEVWLATAAFRTTEEVYAHLPRPKTGQVLPLVLTRGKVWAFHDLSARNGPFKRVVDVATAERREGDAVLRDDRNIFVWLLNAALRDALRTRGVRHDRAHDRYYFLPDHETVTRMVVAKTKLGRNQFKKKVVRQEGERSGNLKDVWWHLAAQLRFEELSAGSWALSIRPEFHLTKDGREPLDPRRVGAKVTRKKSTMYNEGYFDAVHFFRNWLIDGRSQLDLRMDRQLISISGDFPSVDATWAKIDDKRFEPVRTPNANDTDDLLDAVAGSLDLGDEWDWGAEYLEEDQ